MPSPENPDRKVRRVKAEENSLTIGAWYRGMGALFSRRGERDGFVVLRLFK